MRVPFVRKQAPFAAAMAGIAPFCPNCSAPLAVGQDWCLECGSAMPGRLQRGPGLRSALGVVGVTLLIVIGAVAAAYAALSSDSKQATRTTANVPAQTPVTPDVAPATAPGTAVPAPSPAPGVTAPAAPKLPAATPTPTPSPTAPVIPTTTGAKPTRTKPATTTKPKPSTTKPVIAPTTSGAPTATSAKILLDTDAATTYNPYSLAPGSFGDPAKAIDGDSSTSWTYTLDPSTAGKTLVGLAINLKSKQLVKSLTLATATPGMTVEFYGATGDEPVSITDPAWIHLATRRAAKASATVAFKTQGKAFDYLLVWITNAPTGVRTGTIGISEISVTT